MNGHSNINSANGQNKRSAYQRIEAILESAGAAGVHDAHFLFALRWTQFRARIDEMNDLGWVIESVTLPKSEWKHGIRTKHVLRSKPLEVAPGEDWYEKLKGQPRPGSRPASADDFQLTPLEPQS
jgi:hypothetical protein